MAKRPASDNALDEAPAAKRQQTGPAEDDLVLALPAAGTKRKGTSDAGEASAAKRPREREFEHQQRAVAATMAANSTSKEAAVWGKLKGKNKMMQKLRREFVEQFHAHGFGFVEGSKFVNMVDTETYSAKDSYKTEAQIFAAEAKCPVSTAAKSLTSASTVGSLTAASTVVRTGQTEGEPDGRF